MAAVVDAAYRRAAAREGWPVEPPAFVVERPKDSALGDFASNIGLVSARLLRRPPRQIAERVVAEIERPAWVASVEVAGQGFVNFRLSRSFYPEVLDALCDDPQAFFESDAGRGQRVLLEFVSANPTGPLNVVSARAAAIGDTMARLLRCTGHEVFTEFYVNDGGRQVENFAASIRARLEQLMGREAEIPEDGYQGEYVLDLARQFREERGDQAERASLEEIRDWALMRMGTRRVQALEAFSVHFDSFFSERSLQPEVPALLQTLAAHTYEQDGALWLRTSGYGDDKDRVLRKSDGGYTYFVPDIAYHESKYRRGYNRVIDLLGPDHHGYLARMRAAVQMLGHSPESFLVLFVQWVRFLRGGEVINMSKRKGELVPLEELLDDVGRDAARFLFLMRSLDSPLDFDMTLAREQSSENPVFYVQYAHARIASIRRQAASVDAQPDYTLLTAPEEDALVRQLALLPEELEDAARALEPHRLTRMATQLAQSFHAFYNHNRVLGVEPPLSAARLRLATAVQYALRELLTLLGVEAPDRM